MPEFHGKVSRQQVAKGSKSERQAIVLEVPGQHLVLRREGGNPFHDEDQDKLIGKTIRAEGKVLGGYTLLMTNYTLE